MKDKKSCFQSQRIWGIVIIFNIKQVLVMAWNMFLVSINHIEELSYRN